MEVYRITQETYSTDLTGNGSRLYGGRWNPEGVFALYASQSRSLALLENIVHTPVSILKEKVYIIVTLHIPDDVTMEVIDVNDLPANWDAFEVQPITRNIGNRFFQKATAVLLQVPSVLMPEEHNYVLNPLMPAMKEVKIIHARRLLFNDRLMQDF